MNDKVINDCTELSAKIRQTIIEMSDYSQSTMHFGGSLSCVELLAILFSVIMNKGYETCEEKQDKFILSKGHAALSLYATMYNLNLLSKDILKDYQQNGCRLTELVEYNKELGFDCSGGSLGLGLSYAAGMALLAQKKQYPYKVYALLGDGELDEGSVWETIMYAGQAKLNNLIMIVDANGLQSDGATEKIIAWNKLHSMLSAFGWMVCEINGNDCEEIIEAFECGNHDKPKAIIAHTTKGKGISFMENENSWHDRKITKKEYMLALEEVKSIART